MNCVIDDKHGGKHLSEGLLSVFRYDRRDGPHRLDGSAPEKTLDISSSEDRLDRRPSTEGRDPLRELRCKDRALKLFRALSVVGSVPFNRFTDRSNACSDVIAPRDEGIDPCNALSLRFTYVRDLSFPNSDGIELEKSFWDKLRKFNPTTLPRDDGRLPCRRFALKSR